jgi:acyl-CoA thioesterase-1
LRVIKRQFIFSLLVAIITGCAPPIKNLGNEGKNIICFGNSITQGEGVSEEDTYPRLLEKMLKRKVINAGVGGDTTASAILRLKKDVLVRNPYLVIVELGGNDYLQRIPKRRIFINLETIILQIQKSGAMVALCDLSYGSVLSQYRSDFRRLAKKRGAILIEGLMEGILDNPRFQYDYIHPNKEGYQIIASRVYNAIKEYIPKQIDK